MLKNKQYYCKTCILKKRCNARMLAEKTMTLKEYDNFGCCDQELIRNQSDCTIAIMLCVNEN